MSPAMLAAQWSWIWYSTAQLPEIHSSACLHFSSESTCAFHCPNFNAVFPQNDIFICGNRVRIRNYWWTSAQFSGEAWSEDSDSEDEDGEGGGGGGSLVGDNSIEVEIFGYTIPNYIYIYHFKVLWVCYEMTVKIFFFPTRVKNIFCYKHGQVMVVEEVTVWFN